MLSEAKAEAIGTSVLGLIAGIMTTFGSLPQIILVVRTKSTKDLSYASLWIVNIGAGLWIIYGIVIRDMPIILWDVVACILHTMLIAFKWHYERKRHSFATLQNLKPYKECSNSEIPTE